MEEAQKTFEKVVEGVEVVEVEEKEVVDVVGVECMRGVADSKGGSCYCSNSEVWLMEAKATLLHHLTTLIVD